MSYYPEDNGDNLGSLLAAVLILTLFWVMFYG